MKFNFVSIRNPRLEDGITSHTVVGTLFETGETVKVTRYLQGWSVRLRITINNFSWHDAEVTDEEKIQVNKLRESAIANQENELDMNRATARRHARVLIDNA